MQTMPEKMKRPSETKPARVPLERKDAWMRRETRAFAIEIKANDDGTVEGYGSVFGVKDSYDDVIVHGAFASSLKAHKSDGTMPAMLWQHDADKPCGVWDEMTEDAKGLKLKGRLALDTERGKEAHALLKMGALNGLSIGFVSKAWTYDQDGVRTLTELDLWEVSLVTFPANQAARVTGVKSADVVAPKDAERILRDAGFSKSDATAFVSRVMKMGEERRDSANSAAEALKAANRLLSSITSA